MMSLQVILSSAALRKKSAWSGKDDFFGGDPFHVTDKFVAFLLVQVFDDIRGYAGVKLSGLKELIQLSDIAQHKLVMAAILFSPLVAGRVTFDASQVGAVQQS